MGLAYPAHCDSLHGMMTVVRWKAILGLIAGVVLVLSSFAHSLMGWEGIRDQLLLVQVPSDLIRGLKIGWIFGGAMMLTLGVIMILLYRTALRGEPISRMPALVTAAAYLCFGTWALVVGGYNPFFGVFILPGVLLTLAAS